MPIGLWSSMGLIRLAFDSVSSNSKIWIVACPFASQLFLVVDAPDQHIPICSYFYGTPVYFTLVYASVFL